MVENILLVNIDKNESLAINMDKDNVYVLISAKWGEIEATHNTYKYANQIGEVISSTSLGTRSLDIVGVVIGDNTILLSERKMFLNRFFNPMQNFKLVYGEFEISFNLTKSIAWSTDEYNNDYFAKFNISAFCPAALFNYSQKRFVNGSNEIPMFHFPFILAGEAQEDYDEDTSNVLGAIDTNVIMAINNSGQVSVGVEIWFTANGELSNPSLYDIKKQQQFKINRNMKTGEVIYVNTSPGHKTITSTYGGITENIFGDRDLNNTWLQLDIGDNLLRYDADEGLPSLSVKVEFLESFLEVES